MVIDKLSKSKYRCIVSIPKIKNQLSIFKYSIKNSSCQIKCSKKINSILKKQNIILKFAIKIEPFLPKTLLSKNNTLKVKIKLESIRSSIKLYQKLH